MVRHILRGAAAGAAGTTALNAVTYLDMTLRGRPASETPQATVARLAEVVDAEIPGEGEKAANRASALGALTGIAAGVGVGAAYGFARGLGYRPSPWLAATVTTIGALVGTNGPMTALGITDPRTWAATDWVSDIVPHVAYGVVTAATYGADR